MIKFFQKTKGSISIFLVLVMLPMFTCAGLIVDGARISAARTAVSGAADLAMNAALSEYDNALKVAYGLFAMSEDTKELEENVRRYFTNTINNEGILAASDSYTRSFINSVGSLFSTDEVNFENIVDTEYVEFKFTEIADSSLANPTVLERQIVEYMKYRGPISLGTGLLTKLKLLGETSKQTKALEAKVDFEKNLDTVQDACKTAYKEINEYNDLVSGSSKFAASDYLTKMAADINKAKEDTQKMTQYIAALKCDELKAESYYNRSPGLKTMASVLIANKPLSLFNLDSTVKREVEKYYSKSEAENKVTDTLNYIESSLAGSVTLLLKPDGTYDYVWTPFFDVFLRLDGYYKTEISKQIADIKTHNSIPQKDQVFTYTMMYEHYYEQLDEAMQATYKEKREAYTAVAQALLASSEFCCGYREDWETEVNKLGKSASKALYVWEKDLKAIDTALTDAIEALDAVIDKVDDLDTTRKTWSNKVNDLSDSDIKTSMQTDYSNSAKDINREAVSALKTELTNNQSHFKKLKEKIEAIKYYGKEISIEKYDSTNYYSRFSGKIPAPGEGTWDAVKGTASNCMSNYVSADVSTGITPATFTKITEEQQFYKYLKNTCKETATDSDAKKAAKEDRKNLIDGRSEGEDRDGNGQLKSAGANDDKTANTAGMTTGSYISAKSGLSADISKAISDLAKSSKGGAASFTGKNVDSSGSDKNMADNCKSNLTEMTNLLSSLGNVAETAMEYVYLEEYFTEMFSCYTTTPEAKSLSQQTMSANHFFGSEVEYILYGCDTVEGNLNAAKASVFGVRFALNSIFALTSSHTRTPALTAATAIAGWTGFGVPIVQTVILLAWALAESVVDLDNLCKGEAVALYKSNETWVLGINGVIELGKDAAGAVIDDVFAKIEDVSMDAIDTLQDDITTYVNHTTQGVVDSIHGTIMTAIETLALQVIGESNYDLRESDVEARLDQLLASLKPADSDNSVSAKATRLAINVLETEQVPDKDGKMVTYKKYLASIMYEEYCKAKEGTMSAISDSVEKMLKAIANPIKTKITAAVSSVGEELKTEVSNIIQEGGEQVKEKVTSAIDNYLGDLSGGGGGTAAASGFTMTYKEYMKTFVLLFVGLNKTSMLQRCAELIQVNMSKTNGSFNITKACTMVQVNAAVSIRTTFFDVPVTLGVDANGEPVYELDFSNIGTGRQQVKYAGILGY